MVMAPTPMLVAHFSLIVGIKTPTWTCGLGPFHTARHVAQFQIEHASEDNGTYNHAVMIGYNKGLFTAAWKNGPWSEDKDGQRILVSQSTTGTEWSPSKVLFPSLSTDAQPAAMFVGPPMVINGRAYVGAAPGIPTDAAAGAQFCLWPEPLEPKNCGPPHGRRQEGLVMRELLDKVGYFGPMFWLASEVPATWTKATKTYGIRLLTEMDDYVQKDMAELGRSAVDAVPCNTSGGNLKCEACKGGCQVYDSINIPPLMQTPSKSAKSAIGNERTHYQLPNHSGDIILYRSDKPILYASTRESSSLKWTGPIPTDIPTDETNINAGPLPGDAVYLLSNPIFEPKSPSPIGSSQLRFRNPITIALSDDGYNFSKALAIINCTELPRSSNSTCSPRFAGSGKNPGPSYPQGLAIVAPAPVEHRGFYVVNSNNKEDIWLTKISFESLGLLPV